MTTPIETEVLQILSAIEIEGSAAQVIEKLGNDAVSLTCDIASGAVPGLRNKVRTNAAALLGYMRHPQAKETVRLLVNDTNHDVALRGLRAAARMKLVSAVNDIAVALNKPDLSPLLAAEAVKALVAIDSPPAKQAVETYRRSDATTLPHRNAPVVLNVLSTSQGIKI